MKRAKTGRPTDPSPVPESPEAKLAEIKRLYYETAPGTIAADLARAIAVLTSMESEAERERAAVYMDGLSEMRSEWQPRAKAAEKERRPTRAPRA